MEVSSSNKLKSNSNALHKSSITFCLGRSKLLLSKVISNTSVLPFTSLFVEVLCGINNTVNFKLPLVSFIWLPILFNTVNILKSTLWFGENFPYRLSLLPK